MDGRVKSMLQALASQAGFEIAFEDTSDSEDSEYETDDVEGESKEEGEEQVEGEGEVERGGKVERKGGESISRCDSSVVDGSCPQGSVATQLQLPHKEDAKVDSIPAVSTTSECEAFRRGASNMASIPLKLKNNNCLHNNIDDTPTSSDEPSCEVVADENFNSTTDCSGGDTESCTSSSAGNGIGTSGNDHSSKSHLLLDLLTSTVSSSQVDDVS